MTKTQLNNIINIRLENNKIKIDNMIDKLNLVNPLNVLKRGYALPYKDNKIVDIKNINKNDNLTIKLHNGKIEVNVKEVSHEV